MENEFGNFIKKLRGKESLRDVAERCDISHTHIADLEKGINRSTKAPIKPSIDTIRSLSRAYNYPYKKLLEIAGYADRKEDYTLEEVDQAMFDEFMSMDSKRKDKLRRIMAIVKEE